MRQHRLALGLAGALVALATPSPSLASWTVPGAGTAQATTGDLGRPTALAQTAATTTGVTLVWAAPPGPAPDGYVVRRDGAVVASCRSRTATSCTDSRLPPGTSYRYTVTATLGAWRGCASAATTATTASATAS